jgi:maleylacetate reductase
MVEPFDFTGSPARIVFGSTSSARASEMVDALGCRRALVLSTPGRSAQAQAIAEQLHRRLGALFDGAAMHTPVETTERALVALDDVAADCTVAIGGGSTIGLGKAIAYRRGVPQIVIPTTYAGSEATPILGQTENGVKTTLRDPAVLPQVVLYDPDLTLELPLRSA